VIFACRGLQCMQMDAKCQDARPRSSLGVIRPETSHHCTSTPPPQRAAHRGPRSSRSVIARSSCAPVVLLSHTNLVRQSALPVVLDCACARLIATPHAPFNRRHVWRSCGSRPQESVKERASSSPEKSQARGKSISEIRYLCYADCHLGDPIRGQRLCA
jgi:hypothetical protein